MEKVISTIEARMTSTRLPGKVLKKIMGRPALELLIERLRAVKEIEEIVVATTVNKTDDVIADLCRRINVKCFRGSEQDVLGRVLAAAKSVDGDILIEITGDCPLIDPDVIRACLKVFREGKYDYVSTGCRKRTFPDGLDVQVFPVKVLEEVSQLTQDPSDREHVSYYIYSHPERYRLKNYEATGELYWPELAITLDTPQDLILITKIFEALYPQNPLFSAQDIVRFLRANPQLAAINVDEARRYNYLNAIPRSKSGKK